MNRVTYGTLLDACARSGCMDRVPSLVAEMREARVGLDYCALAKGHCLAGGVNAAFAGPAEMRKDEEFRPDEVSNFLLDDCFQEHRLQEALDLAAGIRVTGVRPSSFAPCMLAELLGRAWRLPMPSASWKGWAWRQGFSPAHRSVCA